MSGGGQLLELGRAEIANHILEPYQRGTGSRTMLGDVLAGGAEQRAA
jgi:hypothetical protein